MASELRFDGRVAVITGAGRGLGREHALFLASRGAQVVVNNRTGEHARTAVEEITDAGGAAIAVESDVRTREGAEAPVKAAIDHYGRVDILVNNAGTLALHPFPEFPDDDLNELLDVHFRGAWQTTQAAWPHMVEQGYGRIVMVASRVFLGMPNQSAYAAVKGAMWGLSNTLAVEGRPHGIQSNALSVAGYTQMVAQMPDENLKRWLRENFPAWAVSRAVAWLVHEDCSATGQFFSAWGRGLSRLFLAETHGLLSPSLDEHTPEAIRDQFDVVLDEEGYFVAATQKESGEWMSERLSVGAVGSDDQATAE
jgi:NAD(P)-dependent dehydrogenase (short-subunit alcohol dehydrogenase family)